MNMTTRSILLVFAFVFFVVSTLFAYRNPPVEPWWKLLISAGLSCAVGAFLF